MAAVLLCGAAAWHITEEDRMSAGSSDWVPLTVGILLFDEVEVLDFAGPFEVFSIARPLDGDASPQGDVRRLFRVLTLATPHDDGVNEQRGQRVVRCRNGLQVLADRRIGVDELPPLDVLVIPGGYGTRREVRSAQLIAWLRATAPATREIVASVCTGAFLLAEAGLLDGLSATTHWASLARLQAEYPQVRVAGVAASAEPRPYGTRYVDEGRVVTSAGIAAGIDMALHLVARLAGAEVARQTAESMEYRWSALQAEPALNTTPE
jgi:transcriptional regulator GlxA family with amidase domain